jgi:hypothetical protein
MTNKNNGGWNSLNEDKFDQDENSRRVMESDEKLGFGRLTDDTFPVLGGLRTRLEELAARGDREVIAVLEENGIDDPRVPKRFFLSDGQPATIYSDADGWHSVIEIGGQQLKFTSPDRDRSMLLAEEAASKDRAPRELTPTEQLRVARLAQSGEIAEAASLYVALRLDGKDRRSEREILEDPKYKSLLNTTAITIWKFSRQDYLPDPEFEELVDRASAIKPLSVRIVDCLYDKYLDTKAETARATRRPTQAATPEKKPVPSQEELAVELEQLSDVEIAKLKSATMRHRGHLVRRFDESMAGR